MDKRDFVPLKRVGTTISNKISEDGLDIDGQYQGDLINNQMVSKATFDILGLMTDPRFLNLQCEDPSAGTMTDVSGQGNDGTYQGSMTTGDRVKKGMGWALDFDGTDDCVNCGDDDDFSFGDGDNDEAVTWFGVLEVIDSSYQIIASKWDTTTDAELKEWRIYISSDETLIIAQHDESASVGCMRRTNVALSIGWHTYVVTSPGDGGATAMDNVNIYIDGALVASTATNNGAYVAMENLTVPMYLAADFGTTGSPTRFFDGDICLTGVDGSEWSAFDAHRFNELAKGLYGL